MRRRSPDHLDSAARARKERPSCRTQGKLLATISVGLLVVGLPRRACAGNMDGFYLSSDAALIGGAITATARGGGAAWYNPAGLGHLRGLRLDASVNGYTLAFGGQPDIVTSNPNATLERLTSLDLTVVPAALTATAKLGRFGVALGVFVPSQSAQVTRTKVEINEPDQELAFAYDLYSRYQEYHVGPSLGWSPWHDVTLGASALVTYRTLAHSADVFSSIKPGQVGIQSHYTRDWIQVGLEFILGLQWRLSHSLRMGGVVRMPALRLGQDLQEVTATVAAAGQDLETNVEFSQNLGLEASIVAPARFHAGFAYDIKDWRFAVDGSLQMPMKNQSLDIDLRPVVNARLGATRQINDTMAVGGGLFTDRSPNRAPTIFGQTQLDFYGLTGSFTFGKLYRVLSRGSDVFKEPQGLLFQTTISLSYALGLGTIVSAQVNSNETSPISYQDVPASIVAHEISVHLGSTVAE